MENKLSIKELITVINLTIENVKTYPELRAGQSLFNSIYILHPNIAEQIRLADGLDPYYNDKYITSCIVFIVKQEDLEFVKKVYKDFIEEIG